MTLRFDIINLFDTVYLIRDGSGIGVFAPQYGPRRGFFAGMSKKFGDAPPVSAAYLPEKDRPQLFKDGPAVYNWTGFYIGGNFGGAWSGLSAANFSDTLGSSFTAGTNLQPVGGGQIGVNYQFWNRLVVGAEAMFDWLPGSQLSPITATDPTGTVSANILNASEHALATATGRLGYAWDRVLFYAKGGGAWVAGNSPTISVGGAPATFASVGNTNVLVIPPDSVSSGPSPTTGRYAPSTTTSGCRIRPIRRRQGRRLSAATSSHIAIQAFPS